MKKRFKMLILNHFNALSFDKFKSKVNDLKFKLPETELEFLIFEEIETNKVETIIKKNINYNNFYRKPSEIIFKHNGNLYYGCKNLVYSSMDLLKDMEEFFISEKDNNPLELTCDATDNLMNLYVHITHGHLFDINDVKPYEFLSFLKLIDKYPTDQLSIKLLEKEIIIYLHEHQIFLNQDVLDLSKKYQLKYLYLYIHQKLL